MVQGCAVKFISVLYRVIKKSLCIWWWTVKVRCIETFWSPSIFCSQGVACCYGESSFVFLFYFGATAPQWARASSFTRFLDHAQRRTTVGRTPLDEWPARHRDLSLTTQYIQQIDIHAPGGIRTHSLSRRAAIDLRLRDGYIGARTDKHSNLTFLWVYIAGTCGYI